MSTVNSKYYTPIIEEFHVGFEYYFCSAYQEGVSLTEVVIDNIDGYEPMIFNFDAWNWTRPNKGESWRDVFEYMLSHNQIKVKYLDKEDIESLGFEEIGQEEYYLNGDLKSWCIERLYDENIQSFYRINDDDNNQIMFMEIKNKSELKVLLKQLGIN